MSGYDPYSYYDGCEVEPKEYWEEQIYEIIHKVIGDKCRDVQESNEIRQGKINKQNDEITILKKRIRELEDQQDTKIGMDKFIKLVNKDNIFDMINSLGLEKTNDERYIDGMDSERIAITTKLILLYYKDKELVLDILDLFNIDYNSNLKNFKLPRDYEKDEIIDIMKNVSSRMIKTNGCYFSGNFGFWLRSNFRSKGDEVPLQEVFKSPYIKDCIDIIIDKIKNDSYGYNSYLFEVTKYQDFDDDIVLELSKHLPDSPSNKLHSYHNDFIKRHKELLYVDVDFCSRYFKYANDNSYNTFAIHNFNLNYQIEYLKKLELNDAVKLINEFKIDDERKKGILKQIIK